MQSGDSYLQTGRVKVSGHEFVTTMPAAQLLRITKDPRHSEDPKQRDGNPDLEALYRVRLEVQRLFQGAKERNVDSYAQYIVGLENGAPGITPQVVLFTTRDLEYDDSKSPSAIHLPWGVDFVAIDGETQLAARFLASSINKATENQMVDVRICYNRSLEWAKQAFHDLNILSVRPNAATAIAMDMRDPLTSITRHVAQVPFFKNRVANTRQLKKNENSICTLSVLRTAVVCFSEGLSGLQYGNKSVHIDAQRLPTLKIAAEEYFDALTKHIGAAMEQRDATVAASPAVMAALGALGHTVANFDSPSQRQTELQRVLATLDHVDWKRGTQWDGVAGKVRPDGVFSTAGGAKDSGHTCYAALADSTSPHFQKIRHGVLVGS